MRVLVYNLVNTLDRDYSLNQQLKTVLIVVDDNVLLRLRSMILQMHGFKVSGASSSDEAFECCEREIFDLVLIDLSAGIEASTALCNAIKEKHPQQTVALLAPAYAYVGSDCPDEVIPKNEGPAKLVNEIRELLQRVSDKTADPE
jgi:DNA-binding response OmpR family regulator